MDIDNSPNYLPTDKKNRKGWIFLISAIILIVLAFTFFSNIIVYLLVAFIISLIGRPLVNFLKKRLKIPNVWSCIITLFLIIILFTSFILLIVPLILSQADTISNIDFNMLGQELSILLEPIQKILWDYGLMAPHHTIENMVVEYIMDLLDSVQFDVLFSNIVNVFANFFIGVFSIIFVAFFFLKDQSLFHSMVMILVPTIYEQKAENIIHNSQRLLVRYFVGLLIEIVSMMTLLTITLSIFGVKNALLFGFIGGLLNTIPYLGPVIGATLSSILAFTAALSGGYSPDLIWIIVKVVICFCGCNMIDNFLLQPIIYSNSVKAHPLEIFIVTLMAAQIAGIPGMILAIPAYTLLRIIAKEFFQQSKLVHKLTENI